MKQVIFEEVVKKVISEWDDKIRKNRDNYNPSELTLSTGLSGIVLMLTELDYEGSSTNYRQKIDEYIEYMVDKLSVYGLTTGSLYSGASGIALSVLQFYQENDKYKNLIGSLNKYIDHTILKATASQKDIEKLCAEATEHKFYSVCVNGCYVKDAKKYLEGTDVKVAAVVGFPLGAMTTAAKVFEAKEAIENGASEIDMVINVAKLQDGEYGYVEEEIRQIKEAIGKNVLKVIIETCYLSDEEKVKACELSLKAKADFVKTSTGFGTGGATFEDVKLMKSVVGNNAKVKASGGVKDKETAEKYVELGAERLGTSSGIEIIK